MRIDHHAYQRATRASSVGFLVQAGFGLTLLIFGLTAHDTLFVVGSAYVLIGVLAWLSLIVIFNQHKQERLEALEHDELSTERGGAGSAFEESEDEVRVQARRLRVMYKWMMPIVSLAIALALGVVAWIVIRFNGAVERGEAMEGFAMTERLGWAVSICLAFSAISFIVSRFVAGMAKQPAWQNLRGGAAFMVGNALVMLSIAVAIGFRFFDKTFMVEAMAWAIPIFMIVVAAEVVLNFILNLYRPRVAGETPRPAFDSRILSLLSAPDNLVRSINEAVNYQFGFDVTSSWGYQLFLRSFVWLVALAVAVMVLLNTMVIVEPHQQAVKLRFGKIVNNEVHGSGVLWKLPWPFETAELYDVATLRELPLTPRRRPRAENAPAFLWADTDLSEQFVAEPEPFLVQPFSLQSVSEDEARLLAERAEETGADEAVEAVLEEAENEQVAQQFSLAHAELVMQYHVKPEDDGLLDFLKFSSEYISRLDRTTIRGEAFKGVALRAITQHLSKRSLDLLLGAERGSISDELRRVVQQALDERDAGVRVASIDVLMLRPAGGVALHFEELSRSRQERRLAVYEAQRNVATTFTSWLGDVDLTAEIVDDIDRYNEMRGDPDVDPGELAALESRIERALVDARGLGARLIAEAERDRLVRIIGARQTASRLQGQIIGYRAAPELYKQREIMQVMKDTLGRLPKYVLGVDPTRIEFNVDLEELNPLFNPYDAVEDEAQGEGG